MQKIRTNNPQTLTLPNVIWKEASVWDLRQALHHCNVPLSTTKLMSQKKPITRLYTSDSHSSRMNISKSASDE